MKEFTYRSARSGTLVVGVGMAIVVETLGVHLVLHAHHPVWAWSLTAASVWALAWLAADYYALGSGTIRVGDEMLDIRVGRRAAALVTLDSIIAAVRPTWKEVPSAGAPGNADYRNLMKPIEPNVLLTLAEPVRVRFAVGIILPARRLGLRVDDPAGFIEAVGATRLPTLSSG